MTENAELKKVEKELRSVDVEIRFLELDIGADDDFY